MLRLGVNVDHVAALRQARGTAYPDLTEAISLSEAAVSPRWSGPSAIVRVRQTLRAFSGNARWSEPSAIVRMRQTLRAFSGNALWSEPSAIIRMRHFAKPPIKQNCWSEPSTTMRMHQIFRAFSGNALWSEPSAGAWAARGWSAAICSTTCQAEFH